MKLTVEPDVMTLNGHSRDQERLVIAVYRQEIDEYVEQIQTFHMVEPDQVLLAVSAIAARLVAIRVELQRSGSQRANKLRTSEIDPILDHLDQQFRIHSRLLAVRDLDFRMSGGAP